VRASPLRSTPDGDAFGVILLMRTEDAGVARG
jgi:hypothetical protein